MFGRGERLAAVPDLPLPVAESRETTVRLDAGDPIGLTGGARIARSGGVHGVFIFVAGQTVDFVRTD